ncbi:MAG: hypothetical protein RM021_034455 [Nostoc sp. EkiNYC01]|nr:hypothetical protein [Nostoc sp. EkiNYC01]
MQHIFVICDRVWVLRAVCSSFRQGCSSFCQDVSVFRAPCSSFCQDVSVFRALCSSFCVEDNYKYQIAGGTCKSDRNLSLSEFW